MYGEIWKSIDGVCYYNIKQFSLLLSILSRRINSWEALAPAHTWLCNRLGTKAQQVA
jgi:hypothetical protein